MNETILKSIPKSIPTSPSTDSVRCISNAQIAELHDSHSSPDSHGSHSLHSSQLCDIHIRDGMISAIKPSASCALNNEHTGTVIDANGCFVLPGLIDAHTHIDKSFSSEVNEQGDLVGAIDAMASYKSKRTVQDVIDHAERALTMAISHGVCLLRSHIDIGGRDDLDNLAALVELKHRASDKIELELIALGATETDTDIALMRDAIKLGADFIGGVPALSDDPERSVNNAVDLALEYDMGLDLHIDENESTEVITLKLFAERCLKEAHSGFCERTLIASHCVNLAFLDEATLEDVAHLVKDANISIVSLPICNLTLMGRGMSPKPRGIAPIKKLQQLGVNVCVASDNVQDPFNPFGRYDPFDAVNVGALAGHFSKPSELNNAYKLVTDYPAKMLGLKNYGVSEGRAANLCITDSKTLAGCAINVPDRLATVFNGKLTYQKTVNERWL